MSLWRSTNRIPDQLTDNDDKITKKSTDFAKNSEKKTANIKHERPRKNSFPLSLIIIMYSLAV